VILLLLLLLLLLLAMNEVQNSLQKPYSSISLKNKTGLKNLSRSLSKTPILTKLRNELDI
jgi:hypothetical protein